LGWDLNQTRLTCLTVFIGTFLVKKNVKPKRWHKMRKFKRHILIVYEISDFEIDFKIDFEMMAVSDRKRFKNPKTQLIWKLIHQESTKVTQLYGFLAK
jgi:hypothetical protein